MYEAVIEIIYHAKCFYFVFLPFNFQQTGNTPVASQQMTVTVLPVLFAL